MLLQMDLYARIAALPLRIDAYELEPLELDVSTDFTRRTTVVRLHGAGEEGVGEDVTYDGAEQEQLQLAAPVQPLPGRHTLDSFSQLAGSLDLFPGSTPRFPEWRLYRRWAFESAGLDLALRQAGLSLAAALEREPHPVRFVVSLRLGEPPSLARVRRLLDLHPGTRFKLDPTSGWDERLVAQLSELDCVDTLDLKGAYRGTVVDQPADAALYRLVAGGFPEAWLEDPDLTEPDAAEALAPHRRRITWDAPIHSVADIEALPFPPRGLNIKPSRFGSLQALLAAYDYSEEQEIRCYGGGQFELGPGRGQIEYLAALFHADAPNDVAPVGYHEPEPGVGLEESPLEPALDDAGFRRRP